MPELQEYLDRVVKFCREQDIYGIIFCGGFTQRKSAPGVSEAGLMSEYVLDRVRKNNFAAIHVNDSYTTLDNAELAVAVLRKDRWLDADGRVLTVFCEATRAAEVDMAIRHFLGRRANIETANWELMAPEKRIASMIWTWLSLRFPLLARHLRNKRINRSYQI